MADARNSIVPNMIYRKQLNFVVTGYNQNPCKFENYNFTKQFIKPGVGV